MSVPGVPSRVLSAWCGTASRQDRTPTVAKDAAKWRGAVRLCVCRSAAAPVDACEVPTLQRTTRACGDQAGLAASGAQPRARGWPCRVFLPRAGCPGFYVTVSRTWVSHIHEGLSA